MKLFWHKTNNFGDAIAPVILEKLTGEKVEFDEKEEKGKIVSTGSILYAVRNRDIVWGTGSIKKEALPKVDALFLALRGPLTRACVIENNPVLHVPEIYGDPALLLPMIYRPTVEVKYKIGIIPHYADKKFMEDHESVIKEFEGNRLIIDIQAEWTKVIDEILSCEIIMSSSLHGIIAAEAYGKKVIWAQWTKNIIGGQWKFQDYFLGTGRAKQTTFTVLDPIPDLKKIQESLINSLPWKK